AMRAGRPASSPLPVTAGACRHRTDVILPNERATLLALVDAGLPSHRRHLLQGTDVTFRRAMTVEAPAHRQRRRLVGCHHEIYPSVTALAADALARVHGGIEEHEIRNRRHTLPRNGRRVLEASSHRREPSSIE